jgi:hypothetical protein
MLIHKISGHENLEKIVRWFSRSCCRKYTLNTIYMTMILRLTYTIYGDRSGIVVKVLCSKSEGRWFDSRWCHRNFSLT